MMIGVLLPALRSCLQMSSPLITGSITSRMMRSRPFSEAMRRPVEPSRATSTA
jgi:hypothetical protein